jgi:hypothetical protein
MRENGQTSPTPANVFSMEAFQSQANVHWFSRPSKSAEGTAVTPVITLV